MVKIATLLDGYQNFYQKYFIENPEVYEKLVKDGQSPKTLVIACSDSRVDPSILLDTKPGDIFVIRNVANLVPPFESDFGGCHGTSAAIEYAVNHLKVENIIILGHSDCGGIKALISDHHNDHTFIDNWLTVAHDAKQAALKAAHNESHSCELCEKESIRISVNNLVTFPFVKDKIDRGELTIHGWYFNLKTGSIEIVTINN